MGLFLASESPRRRELLARVAKNFTVEASAVDEIAEASDMLPGELAAANAAAKADAVAVKHPADWVLGADTVVILEGRVYGKPADLAQARAFLSAFSGKSHQVITAVALRNRQAGIKDDFIAVSQVKFKKLTPEVIEKYLSLVSVLDKAGAYAIQEYGDMIIESIEGELENIIGLPIAELQEHFTHLGIAGSL